MSESPRDTLAAAGLDPDTLGPLAALVEANAIIVKHVIEKAAGDLRTARSNSAAEALLAALEEGLHPDHDYLPAQASQFLGVEKSTFNRISRVLLPRRRGGYTRGVDIMAYRGDISHEDAKAYKAAKREAVKRLTS